MKILSFPARKKTNQPKIWDPGDLYWEIMSLPVLQIMAVCFLDSEDFCTEYFASNPWIGERCDAVVLVTQEILDSYGIDKVPSFIFFHGSDEVHRCIGKASEETFLRALGEQTERVKL